ncbi:MAG: carboxylesterase family protein [Acidimicrobiales bacterium]
MTTPRTDERDALVIETSGGAVRGVTDGRVVSWKGIPYAAPPVGSLRFAPPEPHPGWSGVFDAAEFGPASPQLPGPMSVGRPNDVVESEDCLNLNVWAPATPAEKSRAVMVWVHGGANFGGSSSEWFYDGTNLADRQDIVVVSINYRLGMLGGLSLDNDATMGNNDLLDVILAMRWVQDNIANFGGDPHRVTIAGESAGACMISDLLVSDRAEGAVRAGDHLERPRSGELRTERLPTSLTSTWPRWVRRSTTAPRSASPTARRCAPRRTRPDDRCGEDALQDGRGRPHRPHHRDGGVCCGQAASGADPGRHDP